MSGRHGKQIRDRDQRGGALSYHRTSSWRTMLVCYRKLMGPDRHVDRLMDKLLHAIELSLKATEASREAVREILKRGAETGIFFAGTKAARPAEGFDLTEQDRDFLRSLSIRPEPRS